MTVEVYRTRWVLTSRQTYGRMPASMKRRRRHKLTVMLSDEEHKALKMQAETDGLSVADVVRQAVRAVPAFEAVRATR